MDLTKIEVQLLQHINDNKPTHDLKIKRHSIFSCLESIINISTESHEEKGNLLHFAKVFVGSLSDLPNSPKTISKLKAIIDFKVKQ